MSEGLLSVEKMNENGHAVVFDGDMSFVINKACGESQPLKTSRRQLQVGLVHSSARCGWDVGFFLAAIAVEEVGDQGHKTAEDFSGFND